MTQEPKHVRKGQATARRHCFLAHSWLGSDGRWKLTCYACKCELDAAEDTFWAEHIVMYWLTRDNKPSNVWPSCTPCKVAKDASDAFERAKTKRIIIKNTEPRAPSRIPSRPMQSGLKLTSGLKLRSGSKLPTGRKMQTGAKLRNGSSFAPGRKLSGSAAMPGTKRSGIKRSVGGIVTQRDNKP